MNQTTQGTRLISAKELGQRLSLSKRQVFRLSGSGKLPKPLKISGSVRWVQTDIDQWIELGCLDRKTLEATKAHRIRVKREMWIWLLKCAVLILPRLLFFLITYWSDSD